MKMQEELNALKNEVETVGKKLHELTDKELAQVAGGDGRMQVQKSQASKTQGQAQKSQGRVITATGAAISDTH